MSEFVLALLKAFVSAGVPGDDALDYARAIEEEVEVLAHGEGDTAALRFRVVSVLFRLGKPMHDAYNLVQNAFLFA